tara:strand:+ start:159 stop:641 length:483 start_codon:yes stop_codon:yes gene_type:complete
MNAVFFIVFFIFSFQAHANHTKIDKDLINLMSSLNNNVIGINFLKEHKYEMAIEFFISKIENNNFDSASNLGLIYEYLKKDYIKAEEFYKISAFEGNAFGQYNLGILNYIVKKNKNDGYKWIVCSANQGYLLALEAKSFLLKNFMIEINEAKLIEDNLTC